MIVLAHTSHNILPGCPLLNALGEIVSTLHLTMKFSSDIETIVHADQRTARECYMVSLRLCPHTKEEAPKVVHHVEAKAETKELEELELNLRTNNEKQ